MQLITVPLSDFPGGINRQASPQAVASNELRDAVDVVLREKGRVLRRGGYIDSKTTGGASNDFSSPVYGAGRFAYNSNAKGNFFVTSDTENTYVHWMPKGSAIVTLFQYTTISRRSQQSGGATPPPSATDADQDRNAKWNTAVIACDAFDIAIKLRNSDDDEVFGTANENQFQGTATSGGTEYQYEVTVIAKSAAGGFQYGDETPIEVVSQLGAPYLCAANVRGYNFLAARENRSQHIAWSSPENSHKWSVLDAEHIPGRDTDPIRHLNELSGRLIILKQNSFHMMNVVADPAKWRKDAVHEVGTLDSRSVVRWRDKLVFASADGVYAVDEGAMRSLTEDKLNNYYADLLKSRPGVATSTPWSEDWDLVAALVDDHYILSITEMDSEGVAVHRNTLCCYLPTQGWTWLSNLDLVASCRSGDATTVLGVLRNDPEVEGISYPVIDLGRMFSTSSGQDSRGDGPSMSIETGRFMVNDPEQPVRWRQIRLNYQAPVASGTPQLIVKYIGGLDPDPNPASALEPGVSRSNALAWRRVDPNLPPLSEQGERRRRFAMQNPVIGIRVEEDRSTGTFDSVLIAAMQIGRKPLRPGRL